DRGCVPPRASREAGYEAARVLRGVAVGGEDRAAGAERDHDVSRTEVKAETGGHVVTCAGADEHAVSGGAGDVVRTEHARHPDLTSEGAGQHVVAVVARARR